MPYTTAAVMRNFEGHDVCQKTCLCHSTKKKEGKAIDGEKKEEVA